jgi:glycosyltransferase involved in cell wall biosynthesis
MTEATPTLSLIMIVRNEAANLPRSLEPVRDAFDDIVVVDTGSDDNTPDMASAYGARVVCMPWSDDFSAARNRSIFDARGDWLLWLDADNYISPADVQRIREHLDHERRSILWCTEVVVPEGERLIQKRVFPKGGCVFFQGRVHEQLVHPDDFRSIMTPVEIMHWGYRDKAAAREKGLRNLRLLLDMAAAGNRDFYTAYQIGRTLFNLRRFEEALVWLENVTESMSAEDKNPGIYGHAHILAAQVLERLGQPLAAEARLQSLIETAPDYGPAYFYRAKLHHARGDFETAASHLHVFLNLGSRDPVVGFNPGRMRFTAALLLGRCLEKSGQNREAKAAYRIAARTDPGHPEPQLALAALAMADQKHLEARRHLQQCLNVSPGNRRARQLMNEMG